MMAITTIDTSSVAPRDRLDFWRTTVCDQFVPLEVRPAAGPRMHGRVTALSVAETQMRRIARAPHRFERTSDLVRAADEDYDQIALARKGRTLVAQDGRETVIGPGDFVLYDSSRPFTFVTGGDFEYSVCLFPKRLLPLSRSEPAAGIRVVGIAAHVEGPAVGDGHEHRAGVGAVPADRPRGPSSWWVR
jgi:hypothetical protein